MVTRTVLTARVRISLLFTLILVCGVARAQGTGGFKFNNLTVSPYVNLEYMYDSNVDSDRTEVDDEIFSVNPGVDLTYTGNDWGLSGGAWFGHDYYRDYDELDKNRYGERVEFYRESAKGWRFVLGQSFIRSRENDSIIDGGRGLWRDRDLFELNGALSYQLSEKTGVTLSGMYSDLNYRNNENQYAPLYGWREWSAGLELARKLSEKSNLLLSGTYQQYESNGAAGGVDSSSTGYSLMAGFGSRATERISYRALTGAEWFDYANGDLLTGWKYSLDASWLISKKWAATVAGSSYYQPSETQMNQAMQVYAISAGVTYRPARKLTTRVDVAYRREEDEYQDAMAKGMGAATDDVFSVRARADYQLMRYVSVYGGLEYDDRMSDNSAYEYDQYRALLGLQFRY